MPWMCFSALESHGPSLQWSTTPTVLSSVSNRETWPSQSPCSAAVLSSPASCFYSDVTSVLVASWEAPWSTSCQPPSCSCVSGCSMCSCPAWKRTGSSKVSKRLLQFKHTTLRTGSCVMFHHRFGYSVPCSWNIGLFSSGWRKDSLEFPNRRGSPEEWLVLSFLSCFSPFSVEETKFSTNCFSWWSVHFGSILLLLL